METRRIPYDKTVFVCTHARADGRTSCANPGRGAEDILRALKEGVRSAGLQGKIRVAKSGCLDLCEQGPNVFLQPSGEWLCGVVPADVPEVLKKILA